MNRAFLIILAPAVLVAMIAMAIGRGLRVSALAGMVLLGVAALVGAWRRGRKAAPGRGRNTE